MLLFLSLSLSLSISLSLSLSLSVMKFFETKSHASNTVIKQIVSFSSADDLPSRNFITKLSAILSGSDDSELIGNYRRSTDIITLMMPDPGW